MTRRDPNDKQNQPINLPLLFFEGIGSAKDTELALQWLEAAALKGSKKALTSLPNIFASMGRAMSTEVKDAVTSHLPELAQAELYMSSSYVFRGEISQDDAFIASRRWKAEDPQAFEEHLGSPELRFMRSILLSFCLINHRFQQNEGPFEGPFDFGVLAGYEPTSKAKFDTSHNSAFIRSVRQHRCLNRTDVGYMTLLQTAAAKGDLDLAKTLVLDLKADVNACGILPGLSPLWISCFSGNIEVASFLAERGANATCRDEMSGRTILHFLNQFRTEEDIVKILEIGLSAGIRLDEKDRVGRTPLLSTFVGWDFSNGLAARFLLALRSNVLAQSESDWTPLCATMTTLDFGLAKDILDALRSSMLQPAGLVGAALRSVEDEKVTAFGTLATQKDFYRRRVCGAETHRRLRQIVDLLLDSATIGALKLSDMGRGTNPLIGSCFMGQDDLTAAILDSQHCPSLDEADEMNGVSALHWAVERGRSVSAMKLFSLGANPLLADREGLNVFHRAARCSSSLLLQMLDKIDSGDLPKPEGLHARDILAIQTRKDGQTPFTVAVIEGTTNHLEVAEILRAKYNLDYDSYSIASSPAEPKKTLAAYLTSCAIISNLFSFEQVEYVLNLDPAPKFIADTSRATLLHYAVCGWQHGRKSATNFAFDLANPVLPSRNIEQPSWFCSASSSSSDVSWSQALGHDQ